MNSVATRSVVPMALLRFNAVGMADFVAQDFNPEYPDIEILN